MIFFTRKHIANKLRNYLFGFSFLFIILTGFTAKAQKINKKYLKNTSWEISNIDISDSTFLEHESIILIKKCSNAISEKSRRYSVDFHKADSLSIIYIDLSKAAAKPYRVQIDSSGNPIDTTIQQKPKCVFTPYGEHLTWSLKSEELAIYQRGGFIRKYKVEIIADDRLKLISL